MPTVNVVNCPSNDIAVTNCGCCAPQDESIFVPYTELGNGSLVLFIKPDSRVEPGCIALNGTQRKYLRVSAGDTLPAEPFTPPAFQFNLVGLTLDIDFVASRKGRAEELDAPSLSKELVKRFSSQVFTVDQKGVFEYHGTNFAFTVVRVLVEGQKEQEVLRRGMLHPGTSFLFESAGASGIKILNQHSSKTTNLFKQKDFNFEKLGIGGLDKEFADIFRRAFSTRVFPPAVVAKLGIKHVRGMLLHGPPGTGKTLIARQIGQLLNARKPKVVNGPEVLSKYVGESEKNIRDLFADADADQAANGDNSDLHIIIFDELDAICKSRGSGGDNTGTRDSLVNMLLTKIDGVDALNNILLIGMTNRKDMLDEALMRPGRLEVQVEIGLPDEGGRSQILQIHTGMMANNQFLGQDVDLAYLAGQTKNFSGAEIEGLVKSATSFALARQVNVDNLDAHIDEDNIKVTMADFEHAFQEVKPAFGAAVESLERLQLNGVLNYGQAFSHLQSTLHSLVEQVKMSDKTPILTCLLEGPPGSGKSAVAAAAALASGFPFMKLVSAESMLNMQGPQKCGVIQKAFDDAYKSPLNVIVLDEIERLLEYAAVGPHFSNAVLQSLLVLLKRQPPPGRKLLVIGTTSQIQVLKMLEMTPAFNVVLTVPLLRPEATKKVLLELGCFAPQEVDRAVSMLEPDMPIKHLLQVCEMAKTQGGDTDGGKIVLDHFITCIQDLNQQF